ncbi:FG-GAP-like repeat-containing protein [Paenibacillus assamensis]|uniref:FG-GAP-like repeat-containing protein n=1 Tax=Paenibacillus assamensis TaxID=311244 RepID=UPI00041052E1|nr:FG-GAP-like repeat-containing protein [Paenibacillus assamensis]
MRRYHFRRIFCALLTIVMVVSLIAPFSAVQAQASQEPSDLFSKAGEFVPTESVRYLSAGNLDNQGGGDFVIVTDKCRLVLYKTKLDGTFVKECVPIYESLLPHKAEIVELTGDKQAELLVFNSKTVQIYGVNTKAKYEFKQQIPIGEVTQYLAGDFNNDGFGDLILAAPKALHIMQGSGGLSYSNVGSISTDNKIVNTLKSGDWDNDKQLDFALQAGWTNTFVYKNNGDMTFSYVTFLPKSDEDSFPFEVADMNADGYDDIVGELDYAQNQTGGSIAIFYGDASGTFRNFLNTRIHGLSSVIAEDMNRDGYPDLVIDWNDISAIKPTQLMWSNRGQSFSERENFTYTPNSKFTDLNGDGKRDIYYYDSYRNKVTFYLNMAANGYIQFAAPQLPVIENSGAVRVKVTRTDGNDNLAYAEYTTVDGTAKASVDYKRSHGIIQFPHGVTEQWLTIPIIDNDERSNKKRSFSVQLSNATRGAGIGQVSKVDIFIADDDGNEIPHVGAPKWPAHASLTIADVSLSGLTVEWPKASTNERDRIVSYDIKEAKQALEPVSVTADVYNHSWLTKLVPGKKYELEVTAKTKKGVASLPLSASVTVPTEGYDPAKAPAFSTFMQDKSFDLGEVGSADVDGNGIDDLIIVSPAQEMLVRNFADGYRIKSEIKFCGSRAGKSIDMNGDGKEEIVNSSYRGQYLCVNGFDKTEKFGFLVDIFLPSLSAYHAYHIADFTQDNIADILYATHKNELILLKGGENYTFTELSRLPYASYSIENIISGDWDKDGVLDVAIVSDKISVYKGNEDGHFEYVTQLSGYKTGRSNDMNADGYDDIVSHSEQGFVVYYGGEQGFVAKRIENSPILRWFDPYELLDMNRDGYVDIVLLPRYSKPMISFNDRKGSFKAVEELLNKELKYSSTIVFGDFSGDGKTDISIYNPEYQGQHITYINEQAYGQLQFQHPTATVEEDDGHVKVKVKRVGHRSGVTSVVYGTHNGTATAGVDYVASSGTLVYADGETEKTISIPIIDKEANAARTFKVMLEAPSRGTQLGEHQEVAITIEGDDEVDEIAPSWSKGAELSVTEATYQTLTLSWPAALDVDGISTYEIVETNAALDKVIVSGDKYSYTWNSGLIPERTYTFLLRARDTKGIVSTTSLTATTQIPYLIPLTQTSNHKVINTIH